MVHIKISKGLDIPMEGKPTGQANDIIPSGQVAPLTTPPQLALSLKAFEEVKFRLLVKVGDVVKIGQPLAEDKDTPGRMFVSPAAGVIKEIRRGEKRVLQDIVIDVAAKEESIDMPAIDVEKASKEQIIERLMTGGGFTLIRQRPFNILANPNKTPRCIFVKAVESALCVPPAEMQVAGHEKEFQTGLAALKKLTDGPVNLVYRKNTPCKLFTDAAGVEKHTVEGPHPVANASLHIQRISPIRGADDVVWTVSALDVAALGHLLTYGKPLTQRIISVAGPGILPDRVGFFKARSGFPVGALIAGRIAKGVLRFVSGDPLMGKKVGINDFMGFYHTAFTVIPEGEDREFLHFMGLGANKYSFSRAYISGHFDTKNRVYEFTTSQHGEHRAFIDSCLYDKVMPLDVPTMLLVKAVMAEDFDRAGELGLLDVDSEDFALPTFVCPSKMEMTEIIKNGLRHYAKE